LAQLADIFAVDRDSLSLKAKRDEVEFLKGKRIFRAFREREARAGFRTSALSNKSNQINRLLLSDCRLDPKPIANGGFDAEKTDRLTSCRRRL